MSEQRDFRTQTVFTVGQITNVTAQLLLALSARLQLSLQLPHFLFQPVEQMEITV